jgi:arsenite oxidase small subunit
MRMHDSDISSHAGCLSRRAFLFRGGAVVGGTILLTGIPGLEGKAVAAQVTGYPRKLIGKLSGLVTDRPIVFKYPDDGANANSILIKLGETAGGGIGPGRDVVAFNTLCTHMGADLGRSYKADHKAVGPCPFHQSTFDLTRYGIIISGHGTESLPQVLLELKGDDIFAVGMLGLIYGRFDNLKA